MVINAEETWRTVFLLRWCGHVLVESIVRSFFVDAIFAVIPEIVLGILNWDREAWKTHVGFPKFATRSMYTDKERLQSALTDYPNLHPEQRSDALWLIKIFWERMKGL